MPLEYLTVSELNRFIKDVLAAGFPRPVWVCGEIQQYDRNKHKNHIFFDLVEKDPDSKEIIARMGLVIFANRKTHIEGILSKSENAFNLKDDIEVKFLCSVDFYPPHGAIRLIVESIDPTFTLGRLAQEKQRLIAVLKEEGILERNKRFELPLIPLRIGLITSYDSAAYNDFVAELKKSQLAFKIFVRNTLMQGKKAQKDVAKAIKELQKFENLDALVITRGGGSLAELSCFDSETIAKAIAVSSLPVLSGIGHEIDLTITDLAAHTYAKTPTAIAQFLVKRIQDFLAEMDERFLRIVEITQNRILQERHNLKDKAIGIKDVVTHYLKAHHAQMIQMQECLSQRPPLLLKNFQKGLHHQEEALHKVARNHLLKEWTKLNSYGKIIDIVHPIHTMKRGFSITRTKDKKVIKHVGDVLPLDTVLTELIGGTLESQVTGVVKEKKEVKEALWPISSTASPLNV